MSEGDGNPNAFELLPWHEERRAKIMRKLGRKRKRSKMPPSQPSPQLMRVAGARRHWNGEDYLK